MNALRHAFAHPGLLWALVVLPALAILAALARERQQAGLARFGPRALALALAPGSRWRSFCLTTGLSLLAVGLAGPQWGRDWGQTVAPGRDLIIVLDQSRSMYAETPSRIERARTALLDLAHTLGKRGGHRVGLVAFAGRARLLCPLTHDIDHFQQVVLALDLDAPDPDLEYPEQASGTRIGLALAVATRAQDGEVGAAKDIILLSDGDDPARDGEWQRGAAVAKLAGIPVYCVGIGDPDVPRTIPLGPEGGPLTVEGKPIRTKLEEAPLREVVSLTGGELKLTGSRPFALGEYYLGTIASAELRQDSPDALPLYTPRYRWFVLPALVLLSLTILLPDVRRAGRSQP